MITKFLSMKDDKAQLYRFLYMGLLAMREEGYATENKKIQKLSNLLHHLPLELLNSESETDFEMVMQELYTRAASMGLDNWLDSIKNTTSH